jgi:hypothetical protein
VWRWLLLVVAACGRVAFDPLHDGNNRSDHSIDVALPFAMVSPRRINASNDAGQGANVVVSPNGYLIVWNGDDTGGVGNGSARLASLDFAGETRAIRDLVAPPDTSLPQSFQLTWTGTAHTLIYADGVSGNYELRSVVLDADGIAIAPRDQITMTAGPDQQNSVAWNGTEHAIAWTGAAGPSASYDIYVGRLDAMAHTIESAVPVTAVDDGFQSSGAAIAWNGAGWGIAWIDAVDGNFDTYFRAYDAALAPLGAALNLTNAASFNAGLPLVVWTGSEYLVVWSDNRDGGRELYAVRLDATGARMGNDVVLTEAPGTPIEFGGCVVWTGTDLAVVWSDDRSGGATDLFGRRVSATLDAMSPIVQLTQTAERSERCSLIAVGDGLAMTWQETVSATTIYAIYFQAFELEPP